MSDKRNELLYVDDILDSILAIESFVSGLSYEDFLHDRKTFSASIRELEVIGEAVSNISEETKRGYPEVLWQEIKSFRNKIVHEYFGIDARIVWDVVTNELPVLKHQVAKIRAGLEK